MREGAVAVALGAALLAAGCGERAPAPPEPLPPAATTLVGLDGADWRIALPLLREGKLPVLAALRRAGCAGVLRSNPDYRFSPVIWTTIATGKLPSGHGVTHFLAKWGGIERDIPTPSVARKCRAIWTIFSEQGIRCGFVGWWVTWPAEPTLGFMVSDHFSVSRFDLGEEFDREVRDPAFYRHQTYPEGLAKDLRDLKVPARAIGRGDLSRFARLEPGYRFPDRFVRFGKESEFAIAHSVDRTHFAVGRRLLAERRPALFSVYFEGIDVLQHFFWEFMDPVGVGTDPGTAERRRWGEMIERYWSWTDARVGELVEAGGDGRAVMIVSDHGFRPSRERWETHGISGEHRREGLFLFAGPGVRRGALVRDADAVDVTPTVLVYHGLPAARDMDGEPLASCFTERLLARRPLRSTETYETGAFDRSRIPDSSVARDLEERIRALGYIE